MAGIELDMEAMMEQMLRGSVSAGGGVSVADVGIGESEVENEDYLDSVPGAWQGSGDKNWKHDEDDDADDASVGVGTVSAVPAIVVTPIVSVAPVSVQSAFVPNGANVRVTQGGAGKSTLNDAARQWAMRPADERFWTVGEMSQACWGWKEVSKEQRVDLGRVQVVNDKGDMLLMGGGLNGPARFTHYSFGQLCQTAGAPAGYLRELDGELAAKCLETGLRKKERDVLVAAGNVLVRGGGSHQSVGAFLSGGYSRIWNADVVGRLGEFESRGWRVPPARPAGFDDPRARQATSDDVLKFNKAGVAGGLVVKEGDLIAPAGLYASDRDMFAFMVLEGGFDEGGSVMNRGFFVSNSEVGDRAFSVTTFLYDAVCGNHIVWGASEVTQVRLVHRGRASSRWIGDLQRALQRYAGQGTEGERRMIVAAIGAEIGHDKDAVIEKLFKDKRLGLTKKVIEQAWEWSVKEARLRGNKFKPTSVWGMVCGLTRVSQEIGWACDRVAIDQAAGKMLAMAG